LNLSVRDRGLVQIYTGNGKGKTTAALGLALRAVGHGFKVVMIQFLKGWDFYGEIASSAFLPGFKLVRTGRAEFVNKENPHPEDLKEARRGLELAREALRSGEYDLVILDEVNVALHYGLIGLKEVLELIELKPHGVELVLTGRYAPRELLERADLVSEVVEVKHPYREGVPARQGVEY